MENTGATGKNQGTRQMKSRRHELTRLIEQGSVPADSVPAALVLSGVSPDAQAWRSFISRLLLWLGGLALAFSLMFFVAYNWSELGKFARFGMVEAVIILAVIAYTRLQAGSTAAKVSLLVASICLGVLLALYGQTYQTGADPWQLFFNWSLLMLPWALLGRFAAIWILWLALLNLSIVLYHQAFRGMLWFTISAELEVLWLLFLFNTLALATWEALARHWSWLAPRWAPRLLAVASGLPVTWLALHGVLEPYGQNPLGLPVWAVFLALLVAVYRKIRHDLFMLAGACLSGIVVVVAFVSRHLLDSGSEGSFLLIALIIVGLGTGAASWLRKVHRECQS